MRQEIKTFYLIIGPWIIMFLFLNLFPMLYSFFLSLTRFDGISNPRYIGFIHYINLFKDYRFIQSILNTIKFAFFNVAATLLFSFFTASILNRLTKAKGLFRSILFIPYAIPIVATVFIWKTVFNRESGLYNLILELIKPGLSMNLLVDFPTIALILMFVWQAGGGMIIFLAGLQNIPRELVEASDIDGASNFFKLRNIIIPLMSPIILYQAIVGIMLSFSVIVQPILLTSSPGAAFTSFLNQQPAIENYFTIIYAFQQCFTNQSFGYGMAVIWLMFLVMLILTFSFMKITKKFVYYEYQ